MPMYASRLFDIFGPAWPFKEALEVMPSNNVGLVVPITGGLISTVNAWVLRLFSGTRQCKVTVQIGGLGKCWS